MAFALSKSASKAVLTLMLAAIALLLTSSPLQSSAREAVIAAAGHYKGVRSYSATMECRDASGLFPGNFEQTLKWRKGGRFEIVVTKKSDFVAKEGQPGVPAPDFFSDGRNVVTRRVSGETSTRPLESPPNLMPGWEVSGGPVLSMLLDTWSAKLFTSPPPEIKLDYSWGERKIWEGEAVREVLLDIRSGDQKRRASLFLEPNGPGLVGQEYGEADKRHWLKYKERKVNPDLPGNLGDAPK